MPRGDDRDRRKSQEDVARLEKRERLSGDDHRRYSLPGADSGN